MSKDASFLKSRKENMKNEIRRKAYNMTDGNIDMRTALINHIINDYNGNDSLVPVDLVMLGSEAYINVCKRPDTCWIMCGRCMNRNNRIAQLMNLIDDKHQELGMAVVSSFLGLPYKKPEQSSDKVVAKRVSKMIKYSAALRELFANKCPECTKRHVNNMNHERMFHEIVIVKHTPNLSGNSDDMSDAIVGISCGGCNAPPNDGGLYCDECYNNLPVK